MENSRVAWPLSGEELLTQGILLISGSMQLSWFKGPEVRPAFETLFWTLLVNWNLNVTKVSTLFLSLS